MNGRMIPYIIKGGEYGVAITAIQEIAMKRKIMLLLTFIFVIVLAGCGNNGSGDAADGKKAKELRISLTISETSSWMTGAKYFADNIEERTGGRYKASIFPSDQLAGGSSTKSVEMLQDGSIDIAIQSSILWSSVEPRVSVINMPWLINNNDDADRIMGGEGGEMVKELLREKGIEVMAFGESGYRQVSNNIRTITEPSDLKGIKIRVPGIQLYMDIFKTLGADPQVMSGSELFTGLQQGAVDGQENPEDLILSQRVAEVQKHLTLWNYSYDALLMSSNKKLWDSLSEEDKQAFQTLAKEAMDKQKEQARKDREDCIPKLKEMLEITYLTDEQTNTFKEAVKPVYDKWEETITPEVLNAFGYNTQN